MMFPALAACRLGLCPDRVGTESQPTLRLRPVRIADILRLASYDANLAHISWLVTAGRCTCWSLRVVANGVAALDVDVVAGRNHLRRLQVADMATDSDAIRFGHETHGLFAALAGHGRGGIPFVRSSRSG